MEHIIIKNAQDIKNILEPIPAEQFTTMVYEDQKGRCCALGHIHKALSGDAIGDRNGFGARKLSTEFLSKTYRLSESIADVNNEGGINGYNETDPKSRVMHLLDDMIKAGY
jgi:hypothetical protein